MNSSVSHCHVRCCRQDRELFDAALEGVTELEQARAAVHRLEGSLQFWTSVPSLVPAAAAAKTRGPNNNSHHHNNNNTDSTASTASDEFRPASLVGDDVDDLSRPVSVSVPMAAVVMTAPAGGHSPSSAAAAAAAGGGGGGGGSSGFASGSGAGGGGAATMSYGEGVSEEQRRADAEAAVRLRLQSAQFFHDTLKLSIRTAEMSVARSSAKLWLLRKSKQGVASSSMRYCQLVGCTW